MRDERRRLRPKSLRRTLRQDSSGPFAGDEYITPSLHAMLKPITQTLTSAICSRLESKLPACTCIMPTNIDFVLQILLGVHVFYWVRALTRFESVFGLGG